MLMNDQKWILLTGVTGFVGSSLAVKLLAQGQYVVCLSRSDPYGKRTLAAVCAAARNLQVNLKQSDYENLHVVDFDFDKPMKAWNCLNAYVIDQAWHIAAEMAYTPFKLEQSFRRNVGTSCELFRLLESTHPECRRFYYCSTAFTQGVNAFASRTRGSHLASEVVNSYQASKWVAELNLELMASRSTLPLTIFRPSIIMGDEQTGWNGDSLFGPYGMAFALYKVRQMGFQHFHLDLSPDAVPNAIPINRVVQAMSALTARQEQPKQLEFFTCGAASGPSMDECFDSLRQYLDISIAFGRPRTLGDHLVNKVVQLNRTFTDKTWVFDNETLACEIPHDYQPYVLTGPMVDKLMRQFIETVKQNKLARVTSGSTDHLKQFLGMFGVEYRYSTVPVSGRDVKVLAQQLVHSHIKRLPMLSRFV